MNKYILIIFLIFPTLCLAKQPEDKPKKPPINITNNYYTTTIQNNLKETDKYLNGFTIQWKDTKNINISSTISYDINNESIEARFFQFTWKLGKDWQEEELDKINKKLELIQEELGIVIVTK